MLDARFSKGTDFPTAISDSKNLDATRYYIGMELSFFSANPSRNSSSSLWARIPLPHPIFLFKNQYQKKVT